MRKIIDHIWHIIGKIVTLSIIAASLYGCGAYTDGSIAYTDVEQEEDMDDYLRDNALEYVQEHYYFDDVYPDFDVQQYVYDCGYTIPEVFDEDVADEWAKDHIREIYSYDLKEVFSEDEIKEYVHDFYSPEEIFTEEDLLDWYKEYKNGKR